MSDAIPITCYDARRLLLAMIERALFDLDSADLLIRKEAHDWLLKYGVPLAEEVNANIPIQKLKELVDQIDVTAGAFQGGNLYRQKGFSGKKPERGDSVNEAPFCLEEAADFAFSV